MKFNYKYFDELGLTQKGYEKLTQAIETVFLEVFTNGLTEEEFLKFIEFLEEQQKGFLGIDEEFSELPLMFKKYVNKLFNTIEEL